MPFSLEVQAPACALAWAPLLKNAKNTGGYLSVSAPARKERYTQQAHRGLSPKSLATLAQHMMVLPAGLHASSVALLPEGSPHLDAIQGDIDDARSLLLCDE